MTFDEMIRTGWADHEKDTTGVAESLEKGVELVTDAAQASKYASLVTHAVGQHLNDWPRAARLCAAAAGRAGSGPDAAACWGNLSVARHLADDVAGALAAEAKAVSMDPAQAAATLVRLRMLLVEAWANANRWAEAIALYSSAMEAATALGAESPVARIVAVVSNNFASNLLAKEDRSEAESIAMQLAALAARMNWLRVGDWTNDERSDYLLALVTNARGKHEQAAAFAERGLKTIAENGKEPVDAACLNAELAVAMRGMGQADEHARALRAAESLAAEVDDPDARSFVMTEIAKAR